MELWPACCGPTQKQHPTGSKSAHPPPRFAGFYKAWLSGGFSEKVLKRLQELDDQVEGHMRFWVTGGWRHAGVGYECGQHWSLQCLWSLLSLWVLVDGQMCAWAPL